MDVVLLVFLFALLLGVVALLVLAVVYFISAAAANREETVALEYDFPTEPAGGLTRVLGEVSPIMLSAKYRLTWSDDTLAFFMRSYRPVWRIVLAILLLPLGLLLLLWESTDSVLFQVLPGAASSRLIVDGEMGHQAREQLRDVLAGVGEERRLAGWYSDGSGSERYWDGEAWTDQVRAERVVAGPRMKSVPPS
jgi:hypothetical protein